MKMKIASIVVGLSLMAGISAANAMDNSTEPMRLSAAQMDSVSAGSLIYAPVSITVGDVGNVYAPINVRDTHVNVLNSGGNCGKGKGKGY